MKNKDVKSFGWFSDTEKKFFSRFNLEYLRKDLAKKIKNTPNDSLYCSDYPRFFCIPNPFNYYEKFDMQKNFRPTDTFLAFKSSSGCAVEWEKFENSEKIFLKGQV